MDIGRLERKCHLLQWSTDDFDWDAPGADRVSDEQAAGLRPFMADLYWIERIAAVVFGAMAKQETDPVRRAIFESFRDDEARHAEAEHRLMIRWGIAGRRSMPQPNPSVAKLLATLERNADQIHPSVFAAIVPMTELVLDGALVKHLTQVVDDPLCTEVFARINADEARHLAMDFYMLEHYGKSYSLLSNTFDLVRSVMNPIGIYALFFGYFPTLTRSKRNIERMGMDSGEIGRALQRYLDLGQRNGDIARHPAYAIMSRYVAAMAGGHDRMGQALVRLSDAVDGLRAA